MREKPTRKHFLKSSFYVLLFLVFINVFLSLCTIDIFVVKSVIPIPSHISIAFVLLYEKKNVIWRRIQANFLYLVVIVEVKGRMIKK